MATLKEIFANALARTPEQNENINIVPLQIDENGQYDPAASAALDLRIKQATTPMTPKERFLTGRELTQDYQAINPDTGLAEMATVTNKKNGLLPDIVSGFRENYTQGFDVNNLVPQNKGLATKIGEGLGTLARFYDKPIGRFAAAAGLSALTGGVNPMNEGITAYVGRQGNIARNKVYGEALKKMGYTDDQLAGINLSDDIFKNTMLSEYRNRLADYRNTKLDKDSFLKSQKQIMDYLDKGLITEDTAQEYLVLLNKKYQEDNPTDVQYGYKKEQGQEKINQGWARIQQLAIKENLNAEEKAEYLKLRNELLGLQIAEKRPKKPDKNAGGGRARVGNQQYTQEEIQKELKRRGLI